MQKLFESFRLFTGGTGEQTPQSETQTKESLLSALDDLLKRWPACDHEPEGKACEYHKDLEKVVKEYGGAGCGCGAHGGHMGDEESATSRPGPAKQPVVEE